MRRRLRRIFEHGIKRRQMKDDDEGDKVFNPWWTKECAKVVEARKEAMIEYNRYPTEEKYQTYLTLRRTARNYCKNTRKYWDKKRLALIAAQEAPNEKKSTLESTSKGESTHESPNEEMSTLESTSNGESMHESPNEEKSTLKSTSKGESMHESPNEEKSTLVSTSKRESTHESLEVDLGKELIPKEAPMQYLAESENSPKESGIPEQTENEPEPQSRTAASDVTQDSINTDSFTFHKKMVEDASQDCHVLDTVDSCILNEGKSRNFVSDTESFDENIDEQQARAPFVADEEPSYKRVKYDPGVQTFAQGQNRNCDDMHRNRDDIHLNRDDMHRNRDDMHGNRDDIHLNREDMHRNRDDMHRNRHDFHRNRDMHRNHVDMHRYRDVPRNWDDMYLNRSADGDMYHSLVDRRSSVDTQPSDPRVKINFDNSRQAWRMKSNQSLKWGRNPSEDALHSPLQGPAQGLPLDRPHGLLQGAQQRLPQCTPQWLPQYNPQGLLQGAQQRLPQRAPQWLQQDKPHGLLQGAPQRLPHGTVNDKSPNPKRLQTNDDDENYQVYKPWWTKECAKVVKARKEAMSEYNRYPTEETYKNFVTLRRIAKNYCRNTRKFYEKKKLALILAQESPNEDKSTLESTSKGESTPLESASKGQSTHESLKVDLGKEAISEEEPMQYLSESENSLPESSIPEQADNESAPQSRTAASDVTKDSLTFHNSMKKMVEDPRQDGPRPFPVPDQNWNSNNFFENQMFMQKNAVDAPFGANVGAPVGATVFASNFPQNPAIGKNMGGPFLPNYPQQNFEQNTSPVNEDDGDIPKKNYPWWNAECEAACEEMQKCRQMLNKRGSQTHGMAEINRRIDSAQHKIIVIKRAYEDKMAHLASIAGTPGETEPSVVNTENSNETQSYSAEPEPGPAAAPDQNWLFPLNSLQQDLEQNTTSVNEDDGDIPNKNYSWWNAECEAACEEMEKCRQMLNKRGSQTHGMVDINKLMKSAEHKITVIKRAYEEKVAHLASIAGTPGETGQLPYDSDDTSSDDSSMDIIPCDPDGTSLNIIDLSSGEDEGEDEDLLSPNEAPVPSNDKPYQAVPSMSRYGGSSELVKAGLYERNYNLVGQRRKEREREMNAQMAASAMPIQRNPASLGNNNAFLPPPPMPQGKLVESFFNQGKMKNLHNLARNHGNLSGLPIGGSILPPTTLPGPAFVSHPENQRDWNLTSGTDASASGWRRFDGTPINMERVFRP